jgi:hypothetical protein
MRGKGTKATKTGPKKGPKKRGIGAPGPLERLLVVWCPDLAEEQEDGRGARAFDRVVEAARAYSPAASAVRPGVCAMPTRGPSRYFGGDEALALRVRDDPALGDVEHRLGVADGLFAAVLAAHAAGDGPVVVPPGASAAFLAPWPVETLDRPELADLLRRLGVRTLGAFAAMAPRQVLGRLGADGAACHEVAAAVRGELPGYRAATAITRAPAAGSLPAGSLPAGVPPAGAPPAQPGFWGEKAAAEARAEQALERLGRLLGPEEVVVGRTQGGRGPAERARLVPYAGRRLAPGAPGPEPWPGRLPAPSPALVLERPLPAQLVDDDGAEVRVSFAGLASGTPWRLSVDGGPWAEVVAWAGPWPVDERWWSHRGRRRRAYLQLVAEGSLAYLLVRGGGRWWVEGAYD